MTTYAPGEIRTKIQALVGNPDAIRKKGKDRHKYYKKPGKGHNRDTCDACGDAGDILCCDSCPASFHLACVDPPLDEANLPNGGWKCRACQKNRYTIKRLMPSIVKQFSKLTNPDDEAKGIFRLFKTLGNHWKKQNPKKFTLPNNYANYEPKLPGYSKQHAVSKKPPPKPKVNLPVDPEPKFTVKRTTVCFQCDKSSRKGILLHCDYCPACYHLDCLEPPLTSVPSGYWICPLHVQPFLESKYLTSSALSERMRIWDLGDKPTSTFHCLLNFATTVHCLPPIRNNEITLPDKPKVKAPLIVDEVYDKFRTTKTTNQLDVTNSGPSTSALTQVNGVNRKRKCNSSELPTALPKPEFQFKVPQLPKSSKPCSGIDLLLEAAELTGADDNALDKCLEGISPQMIKLLAVKKLSENTNIAATHQMEYPTKTDMAQNSTGGQIEEPPLKKIRLTPTLTMVNLKDGKLLEFHRRSIEIGNGPSSTLDLERFGRCINTSRHQATLYYDLTNGQWEMLNYGEQGSIVNGILYGCDTTVYATNNGVPQDETLRTFKEIVDHKRKKLLEGRDVKETLAGILSKEGTCACAKDGYEKPTSCWEGSAMIRKGDQLQFGCHKFVVAETQVVDNQTSNQMDTS